MGNLKTLLPALLVAAALPVLTASPIQAQPAAKASAAKPAKSMIAYVGSLREDIYAADVDTSTGKLSNFRLAAKSPAPGWLLIDQKRGMLYAANAAGPGSISAFTIDRATGALTLINQAPSGGQAVYITEDPAAKYLITANWGDGSVSSVALRPDGGVGEVKDTYKPTGPKMPDTADDNPPGQTAGSSHAHSRVHMVSFDPSGQYIVANDAGLDRVHFLKLDPATGKLTQAAEPYLEKPGSAPRHFAFAPSGKVFYDLMEQDSMLGVYDFDVAKPALTRKQRLSNLPDGFAGAALGSELLITRDGKYVYAAERLRDTITAYAVQKDGTVKKIGEVHCENDYPRSVALDPSDQFMYSLNQNGGDVTVFRIDPKTHLPKFTGQFIPMVQPGAMVFVEPAGK